MTTYWTVPTIVSQYAEEGAELVHVRWNDKNDFEGIQNLDGRAIQTMNDLVHIARSPKHDIRNKTYYIKVSRFNFENLPEVISGIELRLTARRAGRIVDETVQLYMGNGIVGENKATLSIDHTKTYGSPTDKWGIEDLSILDPMDLSFGVVIRLQSHPAWPHRDPAFIDCVELRIH